MNKLTKLIIASGIVGIAGTGAIVGNQTALAQSNAITTEPTNTVVQKTTTLNLDQDDTQKIFEEDSTDSQEQRMTDKTEQLQNSADDGNCPDNKDSSKQNN